MKNAAAVFGDYQHFSKSNEVRLGNPHYYPSDKKDLDENAKKTALNPKYVDLPQRYEQTAYTIMSGKAGEKGSEVVPESLDSLMSFINSSGSSKYNESWPATEPSLTSNLPDESRVNIGKSNSKEHSVEDYLEKHREAKESGGTLSKFVQRFREQPPLPRTQRFSGKENGNTDFWWLSSPAQILSSTPKSSDSLNLSPESYSMYSPSLSNSSSLFNLRGKDGKESTTTLLPDEESDSEIARMQLRTDKLLNLSESQIRNQSLTNSSKSQHSFPEKYAKDNIPVMVENINQFAQPIRAGFDYSNRHEKISVDLPKVSKPSKPEDDILYKWRLSRKMNEAAQTASAPKSPFLNFNRNSGEMDKRESSRKNEVICQINEIDERIPSGKKEVICQTEDNSEKHKESGIEMLTGSGKNEDNPPRNRLAGHDESHKSYEKCANTCMKCKETQFETNVRPCRIHGCCVDQPCVCREHVEYKELCQCRRNTCLHVPPHTHDICDILPCVHSGGHSDPDRDMLPQVRRGHTKLHSVHTTPNRSQNNCERIGDINAESLQNEDEPVPCSYVKAQQNNEEIPRDKSVLTQRQQMKYSSEDVKKEKIKNAEVDSSKDNVAPVIKQVISDYLFQNDASTCTLNESLDIDVESLHSDEANVSVNILQGNDSSSEEEFSDDEILRELRCRRRKDKNELKMVCEQLKKMQVEKTDNEVWRRMTK